MHAELRFFFAWERKNTWVPYYRLCEYIENVNYSYTTLYAIAVNNNLICCVTMYVLRMSHVFLHIGRLVNVIFFNAFLAKIKEGLFRQKLVYLCNKKVIEIFYEPQRIKLSPILWNCNSLVLMNYIAEPKKKLISCQYVWRKTHMSLITYLPPEGPCHSQK